MDTCLDEPNMKYSSTGKKDMYRPYTGGKLVSIPYAMPAMEHGYRTLEGLSHFRTEFLKEAVLTTHA